MWQVRAACLDRLSLRASGEKRDGLVDDGCAHLDDCDESSGAHQ